MRIRTIGFAGAAFAVAVGAAGCGASGGKAAVSHGDSAVTSRSSSAAAPSSARSSGPFSAESLQGALLDPASWGSGWTDVKDGPLVTTSGLGTVGQIPGADCWTAVYESTRVGSLVSVQDVVEAHSGDVATVDDVAHQSAYQFPPGDAAAMMSAIAKKVDGCAVFKHTDDSSLLFAVQAHEDPVPGLGDQAVRIVAQAVSGRGSKDVDVSLVVRYGDVVIDVGYDSSTADSALNYDLTGKAKAIAAKLGVAAGGS
ncbi:MAG: hypothetical protein HOV83_08910 [Catenulispora sp.]|nr:hypothetical protein [Catenulispora sp.]